MTSTDAQVRLIMRERSKGRTQEQAAVKANLKSRKTVAKYERLGRLPSEVEQPRTYRTRADPFAEDWPQVEQMLEKAPELEAVTLFEWLCEQQPGRYQEGQLRTLQRRVADWRALNREKLALLEQVHRPGEVLQTDGTWLSELGVSLAGQPFKHVLIHCVLPYSNWEWGAIAQSESQLALQRGLQSTLFKLGYVPQYHQTDNTSAATYHLQRSGERSYNQGYLALLNHFGLKPRTIGVGRPEQNGDVESANGGLKQALRQHLLLRGSRDFAYLGDYEDFLGQVMSKRNQRRQERLAEEVAVMKPLTAAPLTPYQEVRVKVNRGSLIRVQHNVYSVPTHLIGHQVTVRIYEWQLEVYYRQILVERLSRVVGQHKQQINYRHLIDTLLRKPGGFRDYRYREALFPRLVFRQAWERLQQWYAPRQADLSYLRILKLAARYLECEVAEALTLLLATAHRWDETDVEALIEPDKQIAVPPLSVPVVNLKQYDTLLQEKTYDPA
ncbi:MAG: IS21 family transposase [Anaerolineae bacterium]|nr:IS21 family transposase [Anaerolineae bacterium]